jgi:hypothetical protein
MASEDMTVDVPVSATEQSARSRSPARGEPVPEVVHQTPLELANLPEGAPNAYTYHHGPESHPSRTGSILKRGAPAVWDPRGGGAFALRLKSSGGAQTTGMMGPSEAVPGGPAPAGSSGSAGPAAGGVGGTSAIGGGDDGPGVEGDGNGGDGFPAWDEDACSMRPFAGSTPITVRFAEVLHWRQRVVYCRPDATVDNVKWTMRSTVGQHVSTFRIGDGFSGHPLARHWHVTGNTANNWHNFQEPRRVLVVMPSFM